MVTAGWLAIDSFANFYVLLCNKTTRFKHTYNSRERAATTQAGSDLKMNKLINQSTGTNYYISTMGWDERKKINSIPMCAYEKKTLHSAGNFYALKLK